jgi:signal transduction histidine kinase
MTIRTRLIIQFLLISGLILLLFAISIYYFSYQYRNEEFYQRLKNKYIDIKQLAISLKVPEKASWEVMKAYLPSSFPEEKIIVLDEHFNLVYPKNLPPSFPLNNALSAYSNGQNFQTHSDIQLYFDRLTINNKDYYLIISGHDIYGYSKIRFLGFILVFGYVLIIFITFFLGRFFAKQALNPLSNLVRDLELITADNLKTRVFEGNGKDEIGLMAKQVNLLMDRIENAFVLQKGFVANASHELRTPLASIKSQLQVAIMNPRTKEEYHAYIESALEDIQHLTLLLNRLLELAQTNIEKPSFPKSYLRIDELLFSARKTLLYRFEQFKVNINFSDIPNESDLVIFGNENLLLSLFINIIENACKFSQDNTAKVTIETDSGNIIVTCTDNGIGILPEDLANLYEPFFRGKNIGIIKGYGIGLSLCRKIIDFHNGNISIESVPEKGTIVTIALPIASEEIN